MEDSQQQEQGGLGSLSLGRGQALDHIVPIVGEHGVSLTSLSLGFPTCKMGLIILASQGWYEE